MSYPLLKRNMRQLLKPLLIIMAVLAMYYGVIIYMYDPELMKTLESYQELMPELMMAVGMTGSTGTLTEFINTYLYGFLMLLFPLIYLLILGNSYVMKYVDSGSMASLLATRNSRRRIIATQAVSLILSTILLMLLITLIGAGFSEGMFPGELDYSKYILLNTGACLLQLAVSALIFFAACLFNESRYFYLAACGIPLLGYLFSMLGNMDDKLKVFKYLSLYSLFPNNKIMAGNEKYFPYFLVLIGISIALYGSGILIFNKKDLSL